MSIEISRVIDLDAAFPTIASLMEELHEYHLPFWPRALLPAWREVWKLYITLSDDRLVLLAQEGDRPAGLMAAAVRRDPALFSETYTQLEDAYVRASWRGAGLGTAMLKRVETWSLERGVSEIRLGVVAANSIGVNFWTKSGFRPLTFLMTKDLSGAPA